METPAEYGKKSPAEAKMERLANEIKSLQRGIAEAQSDHSMLDREKEEVMDHLADLAAENYKKQCLLDLLVGENADSDGVEEIENALDELSGGGFINIRRISWALERIPGVDVEIPADEVTRLKTLFPRILFPNTRVKIERLRELTERKEGPLIMQLPARVMVDGEERPFTIAPMEEIMRKSNKARRGRTPFFLRVYNCVPEDVKYKVWDGALTAWTSNCLRGSKGKNYQDQLEHQADILGAEYGIEADIVLALIFHHILRLSKEDFKIEGSMQINARGLGGDPLNVRDNGSEGVFFGPAKNDPVCPHDNIGIGASFKIPTRPLAE